MNADLLKARLGEKQIKQKELAELIGVSRRTLYGRLHGETEFTVGEILELIECLDLGKRDILNIFFNEKVS